MCFCFEAHDYLPTFLNLFGSSVCLNIIYHVYFINHWNRTYIGQYSPCLCWMLEQVDVIVIGCVTKVLLFLAFHSEVFFLHLLCVLHVDSLIKAAERVSAVKTLRCVTLQHKRLPPKCVAPQLHKARAKMSKQPGGFLNRLAWRSLPSGPTGGMRNHRQTSQR